MLLLNTKAASRPASVVIENLQGKKRVILADNIKMVEDPKDNGFVYDEVIFFKPAERTDTLAEIEAHFSDWWVYGETDPEPITLEDRVSDLEQLLLELMEG